MEEVAKLETNRQKHYGQLTMNDMEEVRFLKFNELHYALFYLQGNRIGGSKE